MKEVMQENPNTEKNTVAGISRRRFLTFAGSIAGAGLLIESCKKDKTTPAPGDGAIDLGINDEGLLNYLYALSQFGAALYVKVNDSPFIGMVEIETEMLADIRDHNIAYRELYKTHLGSKRIETLECNFDATNFTDRDTVLSFCKYISNVMAYGYNGVARLLITPEYVALVAKIASVLARHSAVLRNLSTWGTFSDTTDENGIDTYMDPFDVATVMNRYLKTPISINTLPTK